MKNFIFLFLLFPAYCFAQKSLLVNVYTSLILPAANTSPISIPGGNQTITSPASTVTLTGSGTDADGTIAGYLWSQISGPNTSAITSPTAATTGVTGLITGTYVYNLRVTDNLGATGNNTTQVTVNAAAGAKQWIYINFAQTSTPNPGTKWNKAFGSPHSGVVSIANLNDTLGVATGVGFTTIATANWNPYGGNSSSSDSYNASIDGSYYPISATSPNIYISDFYNYGSAQPGTYDATKPQFRITGLNPAKTYSFYMTNAEIGNGGGFDAKGIFRIVGLTTPSAIQVDGDPNASFQTAGATFTIQPKADGSVDIWANVDTSTTPAGALVVIPALVIKEQ